MFSKKKIIYAADVDDFKYAVGILKQISHYIGFVKVTANSILWKDFYDFVSFVKDLNLGLFIDLKVFDIPNTTSLVIKRCCQIGADIVTIHGSMSESSIIAACDARCNFKLKIFAVTVLTSEESNSKNVYEIANKCKKIGVDGAICSVGEVKIIKEKLGKDFLTITPGIRVNASAIKKDDQKRVYSLEDAEESGTDFIVLGRSINTSRDPIAFLKSFVRY